MYRDYGNQCIPDYDENYSQTNGFHSEKSPFERSQSISKRPSAQTIYQQRKAYAQAVSSMENVIQCRVEHLITCDLNSKEMATVDHCINKLKLLDAKGKIWGQDMILQLNDTIFKLVDIETKDDLELFPIESIRDSQAILNSCIYNSVLAVTIKDRSKKNTSVFLFQCEEISAELIQIDIDNMLRGLKEEQENQHKLRYNLESMLSPHSRPSYGKPAMPAMHPPPESWIPPDYDKPAHTEVSDHGSWMRQHSNTSSEFDSKFSIDDTEKTALPVSMVHRNMDILNHVIDDIETFNNKLDQAVSSNSRKEKKKKKSKKQKEALPPEKEYVDCLQKIKYAFNMITNLDAHLQDPSANDLIHILFKILQFILNNLPKPDLAQKVVVPFLIPSAIYFLSSATSVEEQVIWRSLGDAWSVPRSDWPDGESFPSYVPTFISGWDIPPLQPLRSPTPNLKEQMEDPRGAPFEKPQKDHQFAKATYDFMKRKTRELTVMKGDVLEVLEASKQWSKVKNQNGSIGYVPSNIMQLMNQEDFLPSHVDNNRAFQYPSYTDSRDVTVHSTSSEVTAWLQKKGFSKITVRSLGILTGAQLMSLTKEELKLINNVEGPIVYNEIHGA
ncbi:epidermal growth factor receptor kinase substrate 8-like protein 3b isoform X2 [Rhincodon typus]|uniref:epidermal growth factor receptor kinase substrate 8-like protein 3b isoform X2 n=1 Tax=Rhincodon typus TaxID=259920 RepID=UPI00202F3A1F|nr:epidermal growth factor receptor kinase substrate 8-like protein 3b isoform X2 [Rhincodon typus]